tara:strand:- start:301 stop:795 length:495 start_codon:yes stop_codon:yes gene_type:complete
MLLIALGLSLFISTHGYASSLSSQRSTKVYYAPPPSPPLSYQKFLTLQSKRVVVTIQYSSGCNLRPFFLTAASKLKVSNCDVFIEKIVLPGITFDRTHLPIFNILVDGKALPNMNKGSLGLVRGSDNTEDYFVFLPMTEINTAIARARRRRRRDSTVYDKRFEE